MIGHIVKRPFTSKIISNSIKPEEFHSARPPPSSYKTLIAEKVNKISLHDLVTTARFPHQIPDIILIAIWLIYGESVLNLYLAAAELNPVKIVRSRVDEVKLFDRLDRIKRELGGLQGHEQVLIIRRDMARIPTTKIFRLGVLNQLREFHEHQHGTVSYNILPDRLGNTISADLDSDFVRQVQLLFT